MKTLESPTKKTADLLTQRLELAYAWYAGMISPDTGMFEYLYVPQTNCFAPEKSPIRDIAAVWDLEVLGDFLHRHELDPVVERSLRHYSADLRGREGYLILDSGWLGEPSSIAHSAFLLLALLHTPSAWNLQAAQLAEGILRQQRPDGSYKVFFQDLPDTGEELYAGEAMLSLLEAYRRVGDARYLASAEQAHSFYDSQYFQRGYVEDDMLVFFANWQSQACRLLAESTASAVLRHAVVDYVCRMHDRIIANHFYDHVASMPDRQVSVQVACAVEGLNDALALVQGRDEIRAARYRECICVGLAYLLPLQSTEDRVSPERGGFALSRHERTQRIDITGHVASAFMKSIENGVGCFQEGF